MNKTWVWIVIVVVVLILLYFVFWGGRDADVNDDINTGVEDTTLYLYEPKGESITDESALSANPADLYAAYTQALAGIQ